MASTLEAKTLDGAALDQLFRTARSYSQYLDKPVTTAQFEAIWDIMKYGPTSANMMPARLIWCVSQESKDKLAAVSAESNHDKIRNAPVVVIIGMDVEFQEQFPILQPDNPEVIEYFLEPAGRQVAAFRNSSLQGAYFLLAARAVGLDTGPMSGFDNAAVDSLFFSDTPNVKSNFISAVGYGDPSVLPPRAPRPDFDVFNSIA